jgi:uncharacterized protein YciI
MKAVLFYEMNHVVMEKIMEVYPRHKQLTDDFIKAGKIIAIGPFANPIEDGSMGVFIDKVSVDEFVGQDPFVKEGIVAKATVKEWNATFS